MSPAAQQRVILRVRRTVFGADHHGNGQRNSLRPYSATMKYLSCQPYIWRFQMPRQHRFINFQRADAIVEQKVFAVFYGLPPTFRFFLPTPQPALATLPSSLPTRLDLFWRTTRIVLINDARAGNNAGVSGPCPTFIPNQTISVS